MVATADLPALSSYVNGDGAYVLSISAILAGDLHRPLIIHVGDDTVLDETRPTDAGWCAWCEEAQSPTYLRHEGHDPECPLAPMTKPTTRRASRA